VHFLHHASLMQEATGNFTLTD